MPNIYIQNVIVAYCVARIWYEYTHGCTNAVVFQASLVLHGLRDVSVTKGATPAVAITAGGHRVS